VVDVEGLLLPSQLPYCFVEVHEVLKLGMVAVECFRVSCLQRSVVAYSAQPASFFDAGLLYFKVTSPLGAHLQCTFLLLGNCPVDPFLEKCYNCYCSCCSLDQHIVAVEDGSVWVRCLIGRRGVR
jgi:hypothetical protein